MVNFKAPYNEEEAVSFLGQFLPDDFQKASEEIKVDFKPQFIRHIRKIGEVPSLENLHIYEIIHESENDPRVSLSKDSFRLLAHFNVRKALIFFVSQNSPNYRLSLVTVDLKWESGAKVKREYSNPRRYSFFLGPDARVHTPHDFLVKKGQAKNTTDLLSRFDVEIVTKEFFTKYKGLFGDVSGYLEKDHGFKIFAEKNDIDIDTFSKKLLGQIVFCYFLQRKGWLGARRGEPINKGDKDFMRSLFNRGIAAKKNFYNDYLEYLFYDSLNNRAEGSSDFYRKHFDCQIPFLNGGLFEPPEDYDWEKSFVHIPDKLFSNKDNTGILDVFDLYNFTVYEDDPIDREVSVDPEMLGKVFENLLPENLRKGQGAYYTPREIVHYMCQESLINYLVTETKIDLAKVRDLVINKHFEGEGNKESIDKALQNIKVCDPACGSGAFLVGMLHEIVSARRILNLKVDEYHLKKEAIQNCIYGVDIDPGAVEIAKLRLWLSLVVDYELKDIEPLPNLDYKVMCGNSLLEELIIGEESIKLFDEKLLNISKGSKVKSSLFNNEEFKGKSASARNEYLQNQLKVKQRQMLQLHSENNLTPEKKKELDQEIDALNKELNPKSKKQVIDYHPTLFGDKAEKYFNLLKELHKQYFAEYDHKRKREKRKQIENIEIEFIKSSIKEKVDSIEDRIRNLNMQDPDDRKQQAVLMKKKLECLAIPEQIHNSQAKPYFLWKLNFFEVFQEKSGFDVMIANPPYVGEKSHKEMFREIKQGNLGRFYQGKMDLFYFFLHLALNLSKQNSNVAFITTNYYPTAMGAKKLRQDFKERGIIKNLMNFNELKIFESALGQHNMITILEKAQNENAVAQVCITQRQGIANAEALQQILNGRDTETHYYKVSQKDLYDGDQFYIRLVGNSTLGNENPALRILAKLANQGELLGMLCNINNGIHSEADYLSNKKHELRNDKDAEVGDGIYVLNEENTRDNKIIKEIKKSSIEVKYLKPFFKNSDIGKYFTKNQTTKHIIYINKQKDDIESLPLIKKHLFRFKKIIDNSSDNAPYLHRPKPEYAFILEKIISPQRSKSNTFGYNRIPWYASADVYFITEKDKSVKLRYVLGLLNSKLYYFWLYFKGKRKGETLELYQKPLSEIPIKKANLTEQKLFIEIVDKILSITKSDDYLTNSTNQAKVKEYERQIDQMVYKLNGLTKEEIEIVENFSKR